MVRALLAGLSLLSPLYLVTTAEMFLAFEFHLGETESTARPPADGRYVVGTKDGGNEARSTGTDYDSILSRIYSE